MNKINRLLSIVLILCVMTTSMVMTSYADESEAEKVAHPATEELRCEYADDFEGLTLNSTPYGTTLGSNVVGAWAKYENIDFGAGEVKEFMINVGVHDDYSGGTLSVYIDSISGSPVASMVLPSTGGWHAYTWLSAPVNNSEIVGVHDVYLQFTGKRAMGNFMLLKFTQYSVDSVESDVPTDIAGTDYENEYRLLSAVGVLDKGEGKSYRINKKLTAEELLRAGARIMNMPESEENIRFISERTEIALTDEANLSAAARLATYILGYDDIARLEGDFASACMKLANRYDSLDGITAPNGIITKGDMIMLAYNVLSQQISISTGYVGSNPIKTIDGTDGFEYYHSVFNGEGIVEENVYTKLTGASSISDGSVRIDNRKYLTGDTKAETLLGRNLIFYYTENGPKPELIYVEESDNNIITLTNEDYISYDNMTFKYYDANDKMKTATADKSVDLIYNRVARTSYTKSDIDNFHGSLTLIDNDGDKKYDVIEIKDTYDFVVDYISNEVIYEKYGKGKLEFADSIVTLKDQYGMTLEPSTLNELSSGNVLTIAEGTDVKGEKNYDIVLARKNASGVVDAVNDEGEITVKNKTYKLSDKVKFSTENSDVCLGDGVTLYLNAANEVVLVNFMPIPQNYGYLVGVAKEGTLSEKVKVKIFTRDGKMEIFTCRSSVSIDNKTYKKASEVKSLLESLCGSGTLVIYGLNNNGYIASVDFPYDYTGSEPTGKNSNEKENTLHLIYKNTEGVSFSGSSSSFDGQATDSGSAVAFCVPPSGTEEYYLVENAQNIFVSGSSYKIKAYSTDVNNLVTDVYVLDQFKDDSEYFKVLNSIGETSNDIVCYVCGLSSVYDEAKDEVVTQITYYCAGKLTSVLAEDVILDTAPGLAVGDIVRIRSKNGYAFNIEQIYDMSTDTINRDNTADSFTSARGCRMGTVKVKSGSFFKLNEYDEVYNASTGNIHIYDSSMKKYPIFVGTVSDILDSDAVDGGSKIIVNSYAGKVVSILVIR